MTVLCPTCHQPAPWVENKEKYGKNYGKSYMCYFCKSCDTYVGCHENTTRPLGTMADRETMNLRKQAHALFDPFWKSRGMKRGEAYKYLSNLVGVKSAHIGESDADTCRRIIKKLTQTKWNTHNTTTRSTTTTLKTNHSGTLAGRTTGQQ